MAQYRRGFTTMDDLEKFENTEWTFLKNIKMQWEYDGMAYIFREANLPLYGKPLGSMKENHPYLSVMMPRRRNENYGVNIYVPLSRLKEAKRLTNNVDEVRRAAELEEEVPQEVYSNFRKKALENKDIYCAKKKERRYAKLNNMLSVFKK
ncbi:hypothetical protein [Adlercreutzia sp. ZJ154]|uniref:hypothetical protein n=1 Tax=Adlercreutzia sp. ZJ154 TaxID=2709790 RepID=UPI0013ED2606|nr:hypothetical protein [Adlercreutzia sp. ZJ154]